METRRTDVAVIGAGSAGLRARHEAQVHGAEVVLIESGPYGTTCARVGCMPSKLLIAAADVAHTVARAPGFGIATGDGVRVDGAAVLARVQRERDRFVGFVVKATEAIPANERLRGRARFLGPTTLAVDDRVRVEARAIVVATGARPWVPPALDPVADAVLTSDSIFDLATLPASVAVVGTGLIGLELGQALHRLGVRTALFSPMRGLGPATDPRIAETMHAVLSRELTLHLGVELEAASASDGARLRWRGADGKGREQRFARVLVATGRKPALADLDLGRAGVALDERGMPRVDPLTLQCGELPIFIAGDANDDRPLLHEAVDEGTIAGRNAARFPRVRAEVRRTPLAIMFTDPQLAVVGTAHRDLQPGACAIGEVCYDDQGRARVAGRNTGRVRVYGRRADQALIGAEMFGPGVEHMAHLLAWAIQARLTVQDVLAMPFYHPVLEEGLRTALRDLAAALRLREEERPRDLECGPGT